MHSTTRAELEEQVDYSSTSRLVSRLGSFIGEFDADYFTPITSSANVMAPSTDELGSNDKTQPLATETQEMPTPPELSLLSPTLVVCSEDSFLVVVGAPTTFHPAVAMPSVIVTVVASTTPPCVLSRRRGHSKIFV